MNANNTSHDEHAKAWEQLPWLVNGTLDEWTKSAVERHAAECVACRKELELLSEIARGVRLTDAEPLSAERSLAGMRERLDRETNAVTAAADRLTELSRSLRASRSAALALRAAAVALVVGLVAWFWSVGQQPRFRTLSTGTESSSSLLPRIRVVFDDGMTVAEMGAILDEVDARVVDGPSPHGVYTVEIESNDGSVEVSTVIDKLRENQGVRFAEPLGEGVSGRAP